MGWDCSLVNTILKVSGCVATTNIRLVGFKHKFKLLGEILNTPFPERTEMGWELLKSCIKSSAIFLLTEADAVFTTSIASTSKWLRDFLDRMHAIFIDEAGCVTETDTLIPYKDNHVHLIKAGDPAQLGPCQLVSRVWLPLALLLETSSDRQHIRHLFGRPLLVL
jgi:hypothetical protein